MLKKKHCEASIVEGLAPLLLTVVHSQGTICRRLWITCEVLDYNFNCSVSHL